MTAKKTENVIKKFSSTAGDFAGKENLEYETQQSREMGTCKLFANPDTGGTGIKRRSTSNPW